MNNLTDPELGMRVLPGVDLALWARIVFALLAVVVLGGIALAVS